jgi:DNA replication and repair protein RecF
MYLKKILLSNFKNIKGVQLDFSRKFNCISGNNGEGKTNLLDAIYYLSMTKSYFSSTDAYTFTFGEDSTVINGTYVLDDSTEDSVSIGIKKDLEKTVKRNGKTYKRVSEHIGLYPIVMVSPSDTSLIIGSADDRRKFLNAILSQTDKEYLRQIQSYNQLLLQRNKLLKMPSISFELLETIDERMSEYAQYIYQKRKILCMQLQESVKEFYSQLSGSKEDVEISYVSDLHNSTLKDVLHDSRDKDALLRYTSKGIHKDDLEFSMSNMPLKRTGSQGQQKSFLVSLKLAQFTIMQNLYALTPILLLDDVFDKLDMQRVEYLLSLVSSERFGQIFISDSNKVRMESILERFTTECSSFSVEKGVYSVI